MSLSSFYLDLRFMRLSTPHVFRILYQVSYWASLPCYKSHIVHMKLVKWFKHLNMSIGHDTIFGQWTVLSKSLLFDDLHLQLCKNVCRDMFSQWAYDSRVRIKSLVVCHVITQSFVLMPSCLPRCFILYWSTYAVPGHCLVSRRTHVCVWFHVMD